MAAPLDQIDILYRLGKLERDVDIAHKRLNAMLEREKQRYGRIETPPYHSKLARDARAVRGLEARLNKEAPSTWANTLSVTKGFNRMSQLHPREPGSNPLAMARWYVGPPPFIGWWNVRVESDWDEFNYWSWWDGQRWSTPLHGHCKLGHHATAFKLPGDRHMCWRWFYPANARVPRVMP